MVKNKKNTNQTKHYDKRRSLRAVILSSRWKIASLVLLCIILSPMCFPIIDKYVADETNRVHAELQKQKIGVNTFSSSSNYTPDYANYWIAKRSSQMPASNLGSFSVVPEWSCNIDNASLIVDVDDILIDTSLIRIQVDSNADGDSLDIGDVDQWIGNDTTFMISGFSEGTSFSVSFTVDDVQKHLDDVIDGWSITPTLLAYAVGPVRNDYSFSMLVKSGPVATILVSVGGVGRSDSHYESWIESLSFRFKGNNDYIIRPFADYYNSKRLGDSMVAKHWWSFDIPSYVNYENCLIEVCQEVSGTSPTMKIAVITRGDVDHDQLWNDDELINMIEYSANVHYDYPDSWYTFEKLSYNIATMTFDKLDISAGPIYGSILVFIQNKTDDFLLDCSDNIFHEVSGLDQINLRDIQPGNTYTFDRRYDADVNGDAIFSSGNEFFQGYYQVEYRITGAYSSLIMKVDGISLPIIHTGRDDFDGDGIVDLAEDTDCDGDATSLDPSNFNDRDTDNDNLLDSADSLPRYKGEYNSGSDDHVVRAEAKYTGDHWVFDRASSSTSSFKIERDPNTHVQDARFIDNDVNCIASARYEIPKISPLPSDNRNPSISFNITLHSGSVWIYNWDGGNVNDVVGSLHFLNSGSNYVIQAHGRDLNNQDVTQTIKALDGVTDLILEYNFPYDVQITFKSSSTFDIEIRSSYTLIGSRTCYTYCLWNGGISTLELASTQSGTVDLSIDDIDAWWIGHADEEDFSRFTDGEDVASIQEICYGFEWGNTIGLTANEAWNEWVDVTTETGETTPWKGRISSTSPLNHATNWIRTSNLGISRALYLANHDGTGTEGLKSSIVKTKLVIAPEDFRYEIDVQGFRNDYPGTYDNSYASIRIISDSNSDGTYDDSDNRLEYILDFDGDVYGLGTINSADTSNIKYVWVPISTDWDGSTVYHVQKDISHDWFAEFNSLLSKTSVEVWLVNYLRLDVTDSTPTEMWTKWDNMTYIRPRFDYDTYSINIFLSDLQYLSSSWKSWGSDQFMVIPALRFYGNSYRISMQIDGVAHSYKTDSMLFGASISESAFDHLPTTLGPRDYMIVPLAKTSSYTPNNFKADFVLGEMAEWDDDDGDGKREMFLRYDVVYVVYYRDLKGNQGIAQIYEYGSNFWIQGGVQICIPRVAMLVTQAETRIQELCYAFYMQQYLNRINSFSHNGIMDIEGNIISFQDIEESIYFISYSDFLIKTGVLDYDLPVFVQAEYDVCAFDPDETYDLLYNLQVMPESIMLALRHLPSSGNAYVESFNALNFLWRSDKIDLLESIYPPYGKFDINVLIHQNGLDATVQTISDLNKIDQKWESKAMDIIESYGKYNKLVRACDMVCLALSVIAAVGDTIHTVNMLNDDGTSGIEKVLQTTKCILLWASVALNLLKVLPTSMVVGMLQKVGVTVARESVKQVLEKAAAVIGVVLDAIEVVINICDLIDACEEGDNLKMQYYSVTLALNLAALTASILILAALLCGLGSIPFLNIAAIAIAVIMIIVNILYTQAETVRAANEWFDDHFMEVTGVSIDEYDITYSETLDSSNPSRYYWSYDHRLISGSAGSYQLHTKYRLVGSMQTFIDNLQLQMSGESTPIGVYWEINRTLIPYYGDVNEKSWTGYTKWNYVYDSIDYTNSQPWPWVQYFHAPVPANRRLSVDVDFTVALDQTTPRLRLIDRHWFVGRYMKDSFDWGYYIETNLPTEGSFLSEQFLDLGAVFPETISALNTILEASIDLGKTYRGTIDFKTYTVGSSKLPFKWTTTGSHVISNEVMGHCKVMNFGAGTVYIDLAFNSDRDAIMGAYGKLYNGHSYDWSNPNGYMHITHGTSSSATYLYLDAIGRGEGTVEFWVYSLEDTDLYFNTGQIKVLQLKSDALWGYQSDHTVHELTPWSHNTWHHVSISFKNVAGSDTFSLHIVVDGRDYAYFSRYSFGARYLSGFQFVTTASLYIDALGCDWDPKYAVGNNKLPLQPYEWTNSSDFSEYGELFTITGTPSQAFTLSEVGFRSMEDSTIPSGSNPAYVDLTIVAYPSMDTIVGPIRFGTGGGYSMDSFYGEAMNNYWVSIPVSASLTAGNQYALIFKPETGKLVTLGVDQNPSGQIFHAGNRLVKTGSGFRSVAGDYAFYLTISDKQDTTIVNDKFESGCDAPGLGQTFTATATAINWIKISNYASSYNINVDPKRFEGEPDPPKKVTIGLYAADNNDIPRGSPLFQKTVSIEGWLSGWLQWKKIDFMYGGLIVGQKYAITFESDGSGYLAMPTTGDLYSGGKRISRAADDIWQATGTADLNFQISCQEGLYHLGGQSLVHQYEKTILIEPASSEPNYQVKLLLNSNFEYTNCRPSGEDIRFSDEAGRNLPYWIETWKSGVQLSSIIWVKLLKEGTSEIAMVYGNKLAPSASNGKATFQLFDEFDGMTLDGAAWDVEEDTYSKVQMKGTYIELWSNVTIGGTNWNCRTLAYQGIDDSDVSHGGSSTTLTNGVYKCNMDWSTEASDVATTTAGTDGYRTQWTTVDFQRTSTSQALFYENDVLKATHTTNIPQGDLPVTFMARSVYYGPGSVWGSIIRSKPLPDGSPFGVGTALRANTRVDYEDGTSAGCRKPYIDVNWVAVRKCGNNEPVASVFTISTREDYESYIDGEIPTTNHIIRSSSVDATYTVEELETRDKVGHFNDEDSNTALIVGINIDRVLQDYDAVTWDINFQDITYGMSAVMGLFSPSEEALLIISAYHSNDGLTREIYVWDANGILCVFNFAFDTWYSLMIIYRSDGTYSFSIDGLSMTSGRQLGNVGNIVKYLAFIDSDSNWEGYIDEVETNRIPSYLPIETFSDFNREAIVNGDGDVGAWTYGGDVDTCKIRAADFDMGLGTSRSMKMYDIHGWGEGYSGVKELVVFDTPTPETPGVDYPYVFSADYYIDSYELVSCCLGEGTTIATPVNRVFWRFEANGNIWYYDGTYKDSGLDWSLDTRLTLEVWLISSTQFKMRISQNGGAFSAWTAALNNQGTWTGAVKNFNIYTGHDQKTISYIDNIKPNWWESFAAIKEIFEAPIWYVGMPSDPTSGLLGSYDFWKSSTATYEIVSGQNLKFVDNTASGSCGVGVTFSTAGSIGDTFKMKFRMTTTGSHNPLLFYQGATLGIHCGVDAASGKWYYYTDAEGIVPFANCPYSSSWQTVEIKFLSTTQFQIRINGDTWYTGNCRNALSGSSCVVTKWAYDGTTSNHYVAEVDDVEANWIMPS